MNKTLKGKLLIGTVVSVISINIAFTIFISIFFNNSFKDSIIEDMENIKITSINIIRQKEVAEEPLWKSLSPINDVVQGYVSFSNEEGKINQSVGKAVNSEEINSIILESNNIKSLIKFKNLNKSYYITYNYPVYLDENFISNLIIQKDYTNKFYEMIKTIIIILLGQVLVVITLILTIASIIKKSIMPLNKLNESMKNFKLGKYTEDIEVSSEDEISDLAKTYNLMKNQLINQDKSLREFFNNATHELKTPVTSISLYSQILRDNDIKEMDEEFINRASSRIVLECEKMKTLVENILETSRGSINRDKVKTKFSLKDLIMQIEEDFEVRINKRNLKIINEIQELEYLGVLEDFELIFVNLFDNSIKYTSSKEIEVKLSKEEETTSLIIKNKINKIPEDIKNRLLEPFIKHNNINDISKEISSSGLGLYLCGEIAKENNWKLSYDIIEEFITFKLEL
ncbi:HAMP domain-containing histidine kinase [Clostridium sartagoforme]|uniref:histidine kinase n=1 Tax=Clostridium sartagoforme TaxID=84031 RepID=A0A4S2DNR7_9CLOT|nr:HAMP domain-containing sensor histidine kinase [Clostridium sartagoforme]TGY44016.1 HAMP domain-containing histidine kinase [Clostridium sartagoforme]